MLDYKPFLYCGVVATFAYIVTATFTYIMMFWKYKTSSERFTPSAQKQSMFQVFQRSRFHLSVMIVVTYVMFINIPLLYFTFSSLPNETRIRDSVKNQKRGIILLIFSVGYASDAIIFIFMQRHVRKLLWKWLSYICCLKKNSGKKHVNAVNRQKDVVDGQESTMSISRV